MINRGGTFLGSARFPEFRDEHVREVAIENMKNVASTHWLLLVVTARTWVQNV